MTAKLEEHDRHAEAALEDLFGWMYQHREALLALARGRHVLGHFLYQDKLMYEYDVPRLEAEAAEEIADAINYFARRRALHSLCKKRTKE